MKIEEPEKLPRQVATKITSDRPIQRQISVPTNQEKPTYQRQISTPVERGLKNVLESARNDVMNEKAI